MIKAFHHIGAFGVWVCGCYMAWWLSRTADQLEMVRFLYLLALINIAGSVYKLVAPETEDT